MHAASTRWRFKPGDRVRCLHDRALGPGLIEYVGVDSTVIYLGHNDWVTEHITFATISFEGHVRNVKLDELVSETQVDQYDSLRPGDFVVYGKKKHARGIVLSVSDRPEWRNYAAANRVFVLENGSRKALPLKQEIITIVRADEAYD